MNFSKRFVCLFVCMGFMALITTLVLCARSQDSVMSCQCVGYMSFFGLLDLRAEESRVLRHVKPPRCGEESRRPHALSRVRTQSIGACAYSLIVRNATLKLTNTHVMSQHISGLVARNFQRLFSS